jgi:hypothetical protein
MVKCVLVAQNCDKCCRFLDKKLSICPHCSGKLRPVYDKQESD